MTMGAPTVVDWVIVSQSAPNWRQFNRNRPAISDARTTWHLLLPTGSIAPTTATVIILSLIHMYNIITKFYNKIEIVMIKNK